MKRPLFLIGLCYLSTMAAAFYFGLPVALLLLSIVGVAIFFLMKSKMKEILVLAAVSLSALILFSLYTVFFYAPIAEAAGERVSIDATILDIERAGTTLYFDAAAKLHGGSVDGCNVMMRITCYSEIAAEVGESIHCDVLLAPVSATVDFRRYYLSDGYYLNGIIKGEIVYSDTSFHPVRSLVARYREWAAERMENLLSGEVGEILSSMMLGTGNMPNKVKNDFRTAGLSHIVAVSGQHLAIFSHLIGMLLAALGMKSRWADIVNLIIVLLFALAAGMSPSITRAAIMMTIYLTARLIDRKSDALSSLGITALIMCTINPYVAGSLSYQLSFLATFGIILMVPVVDGAVRRLVVSHFGTDRWIKPISGACAVTLSAQIFTLPVTSYVFGTVSLVSLPANLSVFMLVPFILSSGFIAALLSGILPPLASAIAVLCGLSVRAVVAIAAFFAELPFSVVSLNESYQFVWLCGCTGLGLLLLLLKPSKRTVLGCAVASFASLCIATGIFQLMTAGSSEVLYFEESDTVAVIQKSGTTVIGVPKEAYQAGHIYSALERLGVQSDFTIAALSLDTAIGAGMTRFVCNGPPVRVTAPYSQAISSYFRVAAVDYFPLTQEELENCKKEIKRAMILEESRGQDTGKYDIIKRNAVRIWSPVEGVRRYRMYG